MELNEQSPFVASWLTLTSMQERVANELENALQAAHQLSLREFYVLLFLAQASEKKLRLQQLQEMVNLSQSALSRLVARMEAKSCGALQRHVCQDDRRGIYTSLTAYGEEKLAKAKKTFQQTLNEALKKDEVYQGLTQLVKELGNYK
ncbi:MarR family winged helix-turn-helix transcriptional regulator [Niallia sp. NCCP-28]|uniref:MarR family winged helix-turn-helix transcriptional regulator n=1 Tax=Niallia sp. NCCP-28 TaxID=2934712 RepID=UPI0020866FF7|nr:MarR family transcriptional regulator [Niallia sp. NCCP-28]GKU82215.1 MarR family transcriptional regulator [Niallia sp. NCCP-28]